MVEIGTPGKHRDRLLAGIDEIEIFLPGCRVWPHAEHAVFSLQHALTASGNAPGNQHRHADAEIDIAAIGNVCGHAGSYLLYCQTHAHGAIATKRWTNMPGVTTISGSVLSTNWRTSANVVVAAVAITGLKLRAVFA